MPKKLISAKKIIVARRTANDENKHSDHVEIARTDSTSEIAETATPLASTTMSASSTPLAPSTMSASSSATALTSSPLTSSPTESPPQPQPHPSSTEMTTLPAIHLRDSTMAATSASSSAATAAAIEEVEEGTTVTVGTTARTEAPKRYCRVAECRFSSTHVTAAHRCGKCGAFGHGVVECDDQARRDQLVRFTGDQLPASLRCTLTGCRFPYTHTNDAHQCGKCGERGHSAMNCPLFPLAPPTAIQPAPHASMPFHTHTSSYFSAPSTYSGSLPGGVGGSSAIKKAKDDCISFNCPMCRVRNTVRLSQPNVYNVEFDCVVCNDAKAQVFNPACGHVCVCWSCAKQLQ